MTEAFDPYHKWLAIPPGKRPPDHYELLGVTRFESDVDVILNAADRRMAHIKSFANGPHAKISQFLLNQLSRARVCLTNLEEKAAYDKQLRVAHSLQQPLVPPPTPSTIHSIHDDSVNIRHAAHGNPWLGLLVTLPILAGVVFGLWYLASEGSLGKITSRLAQVLPNDNSQTPTTPAQSTPSTSDPNSSSDASLRSGDTTGNAENGDLRAGHPFAKSPDGGPDGNSGDVENHPRGQALIADFVAELDEAFISLGEHRYEDFQRHERNAKIMVENLRNNRAQAAENLAVLSDIGSAYETVWRLAVSALPNLEQNQIVVPKTGSRYRVMKASEQTLILTERRERLRYQATHSGGITIFPDMPPPLIVYLARRADDREFEARRATKFFESISPQKLPDHAAARWNFVKQKWAAAGAAESGR